MEKTTQQLESLTVYVPPAVAEMAFRQPDEQPGSGSWRAFYAATAFADISGFTPLAEELATNGVRGAEELTAILNQVFEGLITTIESHGGQVVKFGGDALSLIWPCQPDSESMAEAAWRMAQAAFAMQKTMMRFATVFSRDGATFSLRMKIGLSAGRLIEVHAGGVYSRWEYVLAGAPMANMSSAENHAEAGEIVADETVWKLLNQQAARFGDTPFKPQEPFVSGQAVKADFYRLDGLWEGMPPLPLHRPNWSELDVTMAGKAGVFLRNYIPGAIHSSLDGGHSHIMAELKPMTVCFVGFGGIDYANDPNAGPALSHFMRDAQEMIYRYEGSVNKLAVGDKGSVLLVLFGAPPFFHEDDEIRAVACALSLLQVGQRHGLDIRVGLTAGPLFAGPLGAPQRREYTVVGDTVNLAARLMQKAHPGEVYVDESVYSKADRFFEYDDLGLVAVKGKVEPRHVYHALGDKEQDQDEQIMGYLLSTQELTGRDDEVAIFDAVTDKVWDGEGQVFMLCGEAGVGKSRLLAEFARRWISRGGVSHGGDCVSYGEKTPYLPWRGILSSVAGLSPRLTPEQRVTRLEAILHRLPKPDIALETVAHPGEEVVNYWIERLPLVAQILGLQVAETSLTRTLPEDLRRDNLFATIQAILLQEAEQRPSLILLEDTHWSDLLSLDLIVSIGQMIRDHKVLVLLAHRPLGGTRPDEIKRKDLHEQLRILPYSSRLMVNELSPESSLKLVQNKLGVKSLPPDLAEFIQSKGQGNPFFIEELVNSLLEMRTLRIENGVCELNDNLDNLGMPDTVQKVVLARIDRLSETVKVTLKVAAAIGRHFQRDLLAAVHPLATTAENINQDLEKLQAQDFTHQEVREDDLDFLFKHVITQEVAYETMLYSQRQQLHTTIGKVLEERYGDNDSDEFVDLLAHHYSRSDDRPKALYYLKQAGQRAIDNYATEPAIDYFTEAIAVAKEIDAEKAQFDLLAGRERAYDQAGNRGAQARDIDEMKKLAIDTNHLEQQIEAGHRGLKLATNLGKYDEATGIAHETIALAKLAKSMPLEARILLDLGITYWRQGNYQEAGRVMQQLLKLNGAAGSDQLSATSLNYLGLIETRLADYEQARQHYQKALTMFRSIGDKGGEAGAANNLGLLESSLGRYDTARGFYTQALNICQAIGDRLREGISLNTLGQVQTILGEYDAAHKQLARSLEIRRSIGDRRGEAFGLHDLGYLYLAQAQAEEALKQFDAACHIRHALGEQGNYLASLAAKGEAALDLGDLSAAADCLDEAAALLRKRGGAGEYPPQNIWWAYYRLGLARHQPQEAEQALKQAHDLVQAKAEQISDPDLRASYMENVKINAMIAEAIDCKT